MRITKSVAALAFGALLAGTAVLAVAGPASAVPQGPALEGKIYWFNAPGELASQSAATQIWSGSNAVNRPWQALAVDAACPAGSDQMQPFVRVPQAGVPEDDWIQIPLSASTITKDALGRFYTGPVDELPDRLNKPDVLSYLATAPGNTGQFPLVVSCFDGPFVTGHFRTLMTITGTTVATLAWSIPKETLPSGGSQATATTTTLTAAASGTDLVLTAAVSPTAAAGDVTFKEGATVLGAAAVSGGTASVTVTAPAAGAHSYTAEFAPTSPASYQASSGTLTVTLGIDSATGQLVLTVPAAPVVDGALTFSVPFGSPVALAGTRASDNSRVTAAGAFPTVTVTDTRRDGLLKGWEVNAQASAFTGTAGTIGAKYLGWTPGTPAMTPDAGSPLVAQAGGAVASFLDDASSDGLASSALLGRAATPGRGVAQLNAALALAIPGTTAEGSYTSTVTVTLVSD